MSDDDFVRRVDALALFEGPDTCPVQFDYGEARYRIAALPAAAPRVKPLTDDDRAWIDARADELFREHDRSKGGISLNTVGPKDYRDYFVASATAERLAALDTPALTPNPVDGSHTADPVVKDTQAFDDIADEWMHKYEGLRREIDMLSDPNAVHINLLRGTIAKPTVEQIIHLYGVDALCRGLQPVILAEVGVELPRPALAEAAYTYAKHLAETIFARAKFDVPEWEVLEDTEGVLTQIDHMVAALFDRLEAKPPLAEAVGVPEDDFAELVRDAIAEAEKAMRKFPQPNYVISKVAEEAGEVVKAAIHAAEGRETMENLRGEMKQTIAMLYRLWVEGDQVHGLPAVSAALRQIAPTPPKVATPTQEPKP